MTFILFAGPQHFPYGGWSDLHSTHDDIRDAVKAARAAASGADNGGLALVDWWQVVRATGGDGENGLECAVVVAYEQPLGNRAEGEDVAPAREIWPHAYVTDEETESLPVEHRRCAVCGFAAGHSFHAGGALDGIDAFTIRALGGPAQ